MNVEDVRVGDRIAPPPGHEGCADPHCGEVARLFRNQTDRVVTITAVARPRARERQSASRNGGEAGEEDGEPPLPESSQTIRCTPGHPFFVEGRGWVLAGELRAGDELEARGELVVVAAVDVRAEQASTFNFEAACHHTYRVSGAAGQPTVLVHNTSAAEVTEAMQRVVNQAVGDIRANPSIASSLMSPGSYAHLQAGRRNSRLFAASFGKAVERRARDIVAADPVLSKIVTHTGLSRGPGGRFVMSADFVAKGAGQRSRLLFDITTEADIAKHGARYRANAAFKGKRPTNRCWSQVRG